MLNAYHCLIVFMNRQMGTNVSMVHWKKRRATVKATSAIDANSQINFDVLVIVKRVHM